MRFGEKFENFFEKISLPTIHWKSNSDLAEIFGNFLPSLTTGHEKCVWSPILEDLFSLLPPCGLGNRFFKKFIFLYEISADPVYMGEMSTPTTPLRIKMPFGRKSENLFSLLSPIHLDRNEPIGRKKSKKISPLAEKFCEKAAPY